jgi:replication-associated recombination protein RarA
MRWQDGSARLFYWPQRNASMENASRAVWGLHWLQGGSMNAQPSSYIPRTPAEFIGPAAKLASVLERKSRNALASGQPIKLLLHGAPGTCKSALANMLASLLTSHTTQIECCNGRNVDIERVRRWQDSLPYRVMGSGFRVLVINEGDTIPGAAQDALLSLLDDLRGHWAVIVTCNSRLDQLTPRLQTRFQAFAVMLPSETEIAALLEQFGLNGQSTRIARACNGNVRAALLDAQSVIDCQT